MTPPFWTPEKLARLRSLLAECKSFDEIGGKLGCTKNAVAGAVHRYRLPVTVKPIEKRRILMAPRSGPTAVRPPRSCVYPIGEPHDDDFRFCGEPPIPGKPYCAEHHAACTVRRGSLDEAKLTSWLAVGPRVARGRGAPR